MVNLYITIPLAVIGIIAIIALACWAHKRTTTSLERWETTHVRLSTHDLDELWHKHDRR